MKRIACLLLSSLFILPAVGTSVADDDKDHHHHEELTAAQLGTVSFPVSCAPDVQKPFERGVALLHSFWYEEAGKEFRHISADAPNCAMAHWGIAMSLWHQLWNNPDAKIIQHGVEEVHLAKTTDGPTTPREKAYIAAIATFYSNSKKLNHDARAKAYSDAMKKVYETYPDDHEAAVFYALSLLASEPHDDATFANRKQAAAILEKLFATEPDHPGVAHYLIHAYDKPQLAQLGLPAARRYAQVAPASPHALHMPSHIFTRVGMWKESVETNRRSVDAARHAEAGTDQLHAYDYMIYADLQMARDQDASRVVEAVGSFAETNRAADYAKSAIPARYAVERSAWRDAALLSDPGASKFPYTSAIRIFARALGAARSGDAESASRDLARLDEIEAALKAAKDDYWAAEVHVQQLGAHAWIAQAKGDRELATSLMGVSPGRLVPARELLGDMLLEDGRAAEALNEYEVALKRDPRRFRSFSGAAQAAAAAGNSDKAHQYYGLLVEMAGAGDARPQVVAARQYLAR